MTKNQRDAIAAPATGLLIYQTNSTPGFYYYSGTAWAAVSTKGANTSLSNLVATSINQNLVPNATGIFRLGQRTLLWDTAYLRGIVFGNGGIQTTAFVPYTAGTGISISGTTITNTAPDKTVSLTAGTGISISGTYPNFTITNTGSSGGGWSLTGNAGSTPGTNFLGTTDAKALMFKVNNIKAGYIDYDAALGNTSLGYASLISNSTGNSNTAEGYHALYANTTGHDNTANGGSSLFKNTTGSSNTADGAGTLYNNINGYSNVALGKFALYSNTNGYYNTATGDSALYNNTTGINNTATGSYVLYLNTNGSNNTGNGYEALYQNTTGSYNTANGLGALTFNNTGSNNTANGFKALYNNLASNNTATGYNSLYQNTTGSYNTAEGVDALSQNTTGSYNSAFGLEALDFNTTGYDNTAIGEDAALNNTTGYENVAIGWGSLFSNETGTGNVSCGVSALYNNTSVYNTAVGTAALYGNIAGYGNTAIGWTADVNNNSWNLSTALGVGATITASNQVRIGSVGSDVGDDPVSIGGVVGWSTLSDGRVKKNIKQNVPGLVFINKLNPVTYNLDVDAANKIIQQQVTKYNNKAIQPTQENLAALKAEKQIVHTGFIAQDVEKAAKSLNYDFSGIDAAKNDKDLYGLRYADFVVPLVKAVQELSKMNDAKDAKIDTLQKQNNDLQKQFNDLKTLVLSIQQKQNQCSPCSASINQNSNQSAIVLTDETSFATKHS